MNKETEDFLKEHGLDGEERLPKVGDKIEGAMAAITDVSTEDGKAFLTLNGNIKIDVSFFGEDRLELLRERLFTYGIFSLEFLDREEDGMFIAKFCGNPVLGKKPEAND